jgi:urease accessory protein UreH
MEIHLDGDATLIAWDAVSAGRVARGERFAFDGLYLRMHIFRDNLPEVVDGFDLYAVVSRSAATRT